MEKSIRATTLPIDNDTSRLRPGRFRMLVQYQCAPGTAGDLQDIFLCCLMDAIHYDCSHGIIQSLRKEQENEWGEIISYGKAICSL